MTDVLIKRELLERELLSVLDFSESNLRRVVDHLIDVGYILAAPRQPEGEGLEVLEVLGYASECGLVVLRGLPITGAVQIKASVHKAHDVPLCRLSDAQRAIAELREECEASESQAEYQRGRADHFMAERDTLRQQRDKLAGLLRECKTLLWESTEEIEGALQDSLVHVALKIDAALAEVNK